MTFTVTFRVEAERDFYQALAYYDAEAPHQSERLVAEVLAAADQLADFPYSSPALHREVRRISVRIFPYQLWYFVREPQQIVEVIAMLHHRQELRQRATDRI